MFIRVESKVKESIADIEKKYPNSVYIMSLDDIEDKEGYLLGVSTSSESDNEFCDYIESIMPIPIFYMGGEYAREEGVIYVYYATE